MGRVTKKLISALRSSNSSRKDLLIGNELFKGHDAYFKNTACSAKNYLEYGSGSSSLWVLANCSCDVTSVDTSRTWLDRVYEKSGRSPRFNAVHVELGPLGDWGKPLSYTERSSFSKYTDDVWEYEVDYDLVLIDGRFRVACFLASLINASAGTTIIFDDYVDRPKYHVVEEYLLPVERNDRQAIFMVPTRSQLNVGELQAELERFRYVMD